MTAPIRITDLIHFHGLTLLVYSDGKHRYIQAKPLVDLAGIDWRTAKRTIIEPDNVTLYGTTALQLPAIHAPQGGPSPTLTDQNTPKNPSQGEPKSTPEHHSITENDLPTNVGTLCFRLDRARMFLARINASQMKAQGNLVAAEALLALQIEWAEVLHDYETKGIAIKKGQDNPLNNLTKLMKLRSQAHKGPEQHILTQLIHQQLADMGYPVSSEPDLFTS